ncbi:MAG: tetratricopeptide repeat protein [Nitrospirae bacterium]|nr:tetratricopeptide repeat protein [Nitrospirota bacterium]
MGLILKELGNKKEAKGKLEESVRLCDEIGNKGQKAMSLNTLGLILKELGNKKEAKGKLEESVRLCDETGNKGQKAMSLNTLGLILKELGNKKEAIKKFEESVRLCDETGDKGSKAMCLNTLGGLLIYMPEPDYSKAKEICKEALSLAMDNRTKDTALNYLVKIYEIGFNDYVTAYKYCEKRRTVASKEYKTKISEDCKRLKVLIEKEKQ